MSFEEILKLRKNKRSWNKTKTVRWMPNVISHWNSYKNSPCLTRAMSRNTIMVEKQSLVNLSLGTFLVKLWLTFSKYSRNKHVCHSLSLHRVNKQNALIFPRICCHDIWSLMVHFCFDRTTSTSWQPCLSVLSSGSYWQSYLLL